MGTVELLRWKEQRLRRDELELLVMSDNASKRDDDETARSYTVDMHRCRGEQWGIRQALYVIEHGCLP